MGLDEEKWQLNWRKKLFELKKRTRNAGANRGHDFLSDVTERRILERLELSAGFSAKIASEYATEVYDMYVAGIDKSFDGAESVILDEINAINKKIKKSQRNKRVTRGNELTTTTQGEASQFIKKREELRRELKDLVDRKDKCRDALLLVFSDKDMAWSKKDSAQVERELHEGIPYSAISKALGFIA